MAIVDELIIGFDRALRTLTRPPAAARGNPADEVADAELDSADQQHAAGLMRVNHCGEICAQALYEGQALTARDEGTRAALLAAAREESDHLAWCEARLKDLDSRPSVLNPAFYAASYALGAVTGLLGDKVSLGFVEATEDQVCRHLDAHMDSLPAQDDKSRRIIEQMREDEARHGAAAIERGGVEFPRPLKRLMTLASRAMTETTYRL